MQLESKKLLEDVLQAAGRILEFTTDNTDESFPSATS